MLRPVIEEQTEAREHLLGAMIETAYPYQSHHHKMLDNAFVVTIVDTRNDAEAGYFWFYALAEAETRYSIHLLVLPNHKKRFFSRTLINTCLSLMWVLGCNNVSVENSNTDLLLRIGGELNDDGEAVLSLPHEWR
jgi:hypothetical protein